MLAIIIGTFCETRHVSSSNWYEMDYAPKKRIGNYELWFANRFSDNGQASEITLNRFNSWILYSFSLFDTKIDAHQVIRFLRNSDWNVQLDHVSCCNGGYNAVISVIVATKLGASRHDSSASKSSTNSLVSSVPLREPTAHTSLVSEARILHTTPPELPANWIGLVTGWWWLQCQ